MEHRHWVILDKYEHNLGVHSPDHPDYYNYLAAFVKWEEWAYNAWPSLDDNLYEARKIARHKVLVNQYQELFRLQSLQNPTPLITQIQGVRNSLGENREKKDQPYIWLCVNPSSTLKLEEFKQMVNKMVTKVWLKEYVYVYEQRGMTIDELGKGFHLHAIIRRPDDKKPSHCIRELSNTFKKACDTSNYHFFQVKFIDEAEKDRKLEYILGTKEFTEQDRKDLKQNMDKVWRSRFNIQPYFFSQLDIGKYGRREDDISVQST